MDLVSLEMSIRIFLNPIHSEKEEVAVEFRNAWPYLIIPNKSQNVQACSKNLGIRWLSNTQNPSASENKDISQGLWEVLGNAGDCCRSSLSHP